MYLNVYIKNVICPIDVCIKMEIHGSFTFNYAASFFALLIIYISNVNLSVYLLKIQLFFMQVCIIEYLLGPSQVNVYRASKKKLCNARTSILEKTLPHKDNFCRTLLCDS